LPNHDVGNWLRQISPRQATVITNFPPVTRRPGRKGPFRGWGYLTRSAGNESDPEKSDPVACDWFKESHRMICTRGWGA
jgi:hypothetical protein